MTGARPRVFLIDGSAIFYRAYFAFIRSPLINSKGENTSATFGFVNSLMRLIREEKPEYLAVVFDTKEPTFRHLLYDKYKATRAKMPDDLVEQLPRIRQAVEVLNIASFEMPGWEADDVVGTLAKQAEAAGFEVWCMTGDKDYFQLVSDAVGIYYPTRGTGPVAKMKREEVREKFGVYPEQVIDKLALMGDSSDNVPGVPGIGPRTADKLLEQFGSLDQLLARHEEIASAGTRKKIVENKDKALLSRRLVTIDTSVPVVFDPERMRRTPYDFEKVKALFVELEFTSLVKLLLEGAELLPSSLPLGTLPEPVEATYRTVRSLEELKSLLTDLSETREVAIDTETTSLRATEADLVGVSLCAKAGEAWYVPIGHTEDEDKNLPYEQAVALLKDFMEDARVQKFGQNIKYDLEVLHRCGMDIAPIGFDTMLASYVLDPGSRGHSLDALALKHFNYRMQPITDLIGTGKKQRSFASVSIREATHYAAEDADFTYRLRAVLAPEMHRFDLDNLYYNIELPLVPVLAAMEEAGIRVDAHYLGELSIHMEKRLADIERDIYRETGETFNINSTQQLATILFTRMGLPTKGKTAKKTGFSTDSRVLEELAVAYPIAQLILDYRQLTKLKNTYIEAIPHLINPETGRVHTSFNQSVAATGRLSSTDPNLQNIPVRTDEGREIRRAFVPRDQNHVVLTADYSQIELRILAHYSEDPGLIAAFRNKEDIHARTAAEVYGVPFDQVTPAMRRAAKTANFAVIYGVSAYGLSQQTELGLSGARDFIDTYFARYPGIRDYMDKTKAFAREHGYVTTLFKRRRFVPEMNARNFSVRQFAERTAINTPIQGTAADMIKLAMIRIHQKMRGWRSRMVLQVHDELVFDVHREELDELRELVRKSMEKAVKLMVPVVVDIGVGDNWLDAK